MFAHFYQNTVLKNPKSIFAILLITLVTFGYFTKDFMPYEIGYISKNNKKFKLMNSLQW